QPPAIMLPDAIVRERMTRRYGPAGDSLAPSADDWTGILRELALCEPGTQTLTPGAAPSTGGTCAGLRTLVTLAQLETAAPASVCIERGMQIMSSARAERVPPEGEPECLELPAPGDVAQTMLRFMIVGDRVHVRGTGLCAVLDDQPIPAGEN